MSLTRNLQTYEMGLGLMGKGGKSRNLALKGIEEEIEDSENEDESEDKDEDEDDDEDEDLTFITNEIIKLLQFRKKDKGKPPRKSKSSRKSKNEKPLIQCHECKGFGHMRIECPNYLMKEKPRSQKIKGWLLLGVILRMTLPMSIWMNVVMLWPLLTQPIR